MGVLTGAGGYFCAGMDLGAFVKGESPWFGDRGFAGIAQRASRKPLIAAIEGFAVAGGMEIALACDLIVAAKGAKMGIPEAKRSLVAAGGALLRLPQRMPYHVVMELALTGDLLPGGALPRVRRRQPPRRAGGGGRRGNGAGRAARQERPARADRLQADPPGAVRLEYGAEMWEKPGRDLRARVRV